MKINLKKAVATFYPSPSYELIYFEAIANAIDAGATEINISINIDSFAQTDTLKLEIQDNGNGFTEENFDKFSQLLEVTSKDHKGLGRLVYLAYFNSIEFESIFNNYQIRTFTFDKNFDGESVKKTLDVKRQNGTRINYKFFSGERIKSYSYLIPEKIKQTLIEKFLPIFFTKKEKGDHLVINIKLETKESNNTVGFISSEETLSLDDLPKLEKITISDPCIDLLRSIDIYYSIDHNIHKTKSISSSICVDGRALNFDIMPLESVPDGYHIIFLFISDFFKGKTNASRQKLELPEYLKEQDFKSILRQKIAPLISSKIPSITDKNATTYEDVDNHYPHLMGYYHRDKIVGLAIKQNILEEAQKEFFNQQKFILECENLDDEKFNKAIELSSRALTEYVLYRTRIIEKLKTIDTSHSEGDIHDLIIPRRKICKASSILEDIYSNNVWMLDDKYMTYNSVLSDQEMSKVISEITGEEAKDDKRPDITLVFSGDPQKEQKVDVVLVELKKLGIGLAKKEEVISQLRQRARRLLKYYPNKIERIWFYGITEIDSEFRRSLIEDEYKELFSHGQIFYRQVQILPDDSDEKFPIDLFIMTYDALIKDAECRNSTFLKLLKHRIQSCIKQNEKEINTEFIN